MFDKETGKNHFLTFSGNGCKKEKNASSVTRILKIWTTPENNDLSGWVLSEKISCKKNNLSFNKKEPKVKKHLHLTL